jgi:hypothetical protein
MEEPADRSQLLDMMEWIGWDRLLFASDYPHWDFVDPFTPSREQCRASASGRSCRRTGGWCTGCRWRGEA